MSKKIHQPGKPLKTVKKPSVKRAKIHKSHRAPGKDYFGQQSVEHQLERL